MDTMENIPLVSAQRPWGANNAPSRPPLRRGNTSERDTLVEELPLLNYSSQSDTVRMISRRVILMYLVAVGTILIWPWLFFAIVGVKGGLEAGATITRKTQNEPQDVNYFITLFTSLFAGAIGFLFSQSVGFFTQSLISNSSLEIRQLQFLALLRSHRILIKKSRYGLFALFYVIIFFGVTPGLNALFIPTPILRVASLSGRELDFASTDSGCDHWFNNNLIPHSCDWTSFNNFSFSGCLAEDQISDVLDSGRNNMLSLHSNNTKSFSYSQLGDLRFSGPIQGVLPVGPNGLPAFNTIDIPRELEDKLDLAITYNYTLGLQGMAANISCAYDPESPIVFTDMGHDWSSYNATCAPSQTTQCVPYAVPLSENSLGFWACDTGTGDGYVIYLKGINYYNQTFANITCSASPMQLSDVPLTYNSTTGTFITQAPSPIRYNTSTELISRATFAIQDVFSESQGLVDNLIAAAVISYGVEYFNVSVANDTQYNPSDTYLRLIEKMMQGMLEYEATYIRMIYASYNADPSPAPQSCLRPITGQLNYKLIGWHVSAKTAAYLIPMTAINLTALILLIFVAMHTVFLNFDPTDVISVIGAMGGGHVTWSEKEVHGDPTDDEVLSTRLSYGPVPGSAPPTSALYIREVGEVTEFRDAGLKA